MKRISLFETGSVVSTSRCPVFLTNEMSGWFKINRFIAKAEIGWFRGISP